MTPEERRKDAVEAAHEWRDELLGPAPRRGNPKRHRLIRLTRIARAQLAVRPVEGPQPVVPPRKGDRIEVRWPGGPYNFDMDFERFDDSMPPAAPGWFWLHGATGSQYHERWGVTTHDYRTLYARYVDPGVFEMLPHGGGTSRESGAADPDVAVRSGHNR